MVPPWGVGAPSFGKSWIHHCIFSKFPKNCMKFKEFGPRWGVCTSLVPPPLDPPMQNCTQSSVGTWYTKTLPSYSHAVGDLGEAGGRGGHGTLSHALTVFSHPLSCTNAPVLSHPLSCTNCVLTPSLMH